MAINLLLDCSLGSLLCVLTTKPWPACLKIEQGYTEPGKWEISTTLCVCLLLCLPHCLFPA